MWDSVPWFVGGGAQHSPEVARLLAYAATSGAEGIITPGDLKVVPLAVPGTSVRVLSGAGLIPNRAAGGTQQTYIARNPSEDVVPIAATGSGSGRSDLIVARVEDPNMAGQPWAAPSNPAVGPYVFSRVIPNVPSSAVVNNASAVAYLASIGSSAIPLAAVILPPSTGTITATEIRDLRRLALPRERRDLHMSGFAAPVNTPAASGSFSTWGVYSPSVTVPSWATHVAILTTMAGVLADPQLHDMEIRTKLGSVTGAIQVIDLDNAGLAGVAHTRETFFCATGGDVTALRGQTLPIVTEIRVTRGLLTVRPGTHMVHDVQFYEQAV